MQYQLNNEPKKAGPRWGCLTAVVLLAVLLVIGRLAPTDRSADTAGLTQQLTAATTVPAAEIKPTATPYTGIGRDLYVANVRWKVLAAEKMGNTLSSDLRDDASTPGYFLRLVYEVENRNLEAMNLRDVQVTDQNGRIFEEFDDAIWYMENNEYCGYETLNPNVPRVCTEFFALPADALYLAMLVTDLEYEPKWVDAIYLFQ